MRTQGMTFGMWCGRAAAALASVATLACGSVSGTADAGAGDDAGSGGGGGDFTLSVAPGTLSVPIASAGAATLSVARTGAVGDITLAAQNVPAGVTVAFATNPIPEGVNTSDVTLTVAGGTAPATAQITFVATAGATERTATLGFTATAITVAGKVRGDRAGVTVRIVGKPAVMSGAGGAFTFTDVIPPYDIYTVAAGGLTGGADIPTVTYYDDVTSTAPVVDAANKVFNVFTLVPSNTPVNGIKSGTGNGTSPVALVWTSTASDGVLTSALSANSTYAHTARFAASTSLGRMMGFQFTTKSSGAPDAFLGFGQSNEFTLQKGIAQAGVDIVMAAVSTVGTITGTVTAPAGYPNPTLTLNQQFGATVVRPLWQTSAAVAADATFPIVATAGKTTFHATTSVGAGDTLARTSYVHPLTTGAISVGVALPAPASQLAPIAAATGVTTSTAFTWTAPTMTINQLQVAAGGVAFNVFTAAQTATIPAVSEVALPPNQACTWTINGFGPYATIDDAVAAAPLEFAQSNDFDGPAHTFTDSASRAFTTAQ